MYRPNSKLFVWIVLPFVCAAVALNTVSQSPGTTAQSTYEKSRDQPAKPGTVFAQIDDPAERQAFRTLTETSDPIERLKLADAFLTHYPQSWVLPQAYVLASNAATDLGQFDRALRYASESLRLRPENPPLLVSVADLQARQGQFESAKQSAREALDELERFLPPDSVPGSKWPDYRRQLRASCYFALGRAEVTQALKSAKPTDRETLLKQGLDDLSRARESDSFHAEIPYLAGLAELSLNHPDSAASEFAAAYRLGGPLQAKAFQHLQALYQATPSPRAISFDQYVKLLPEPKLPASLPTVAASTGPVPAYAGSAACNSCHAEEFEHWQHTGMAKMFRPYRPENVIGDFTRDNKYYDDEGQAASGAAPSADHEQRLFARMIVEQGRHYFEIRQSDGWHRYPVQYTIGSKWEQAYATRLPNGEIHVFPIQYNLVQDRWVNFWKTLDAPGSPRTDLAQWQNLDIYTSYQANCAVCHTSQLRNVNHGDLAPIGLEYREAGIDCEMCHGPSAQHVAAMSEGKTYNKHAIDPPVNFSRITARESVGICAQCHEQSAARHAGPNGELNYSTKGRFYQDYTQRPLGEFIHKAFYKDGRFRGTAFMVEAMTRSECFKKGNVTCGSCHDPHGADAADNPTSLRFRGQPDQMCLQCHAQFSTREAMERHTHHPAASEGSRCVGCHMPRIMDALLFEARSHQIDEIPDADMTARFGQRDSPNACLACHQQKNAAWVKAQMAEWNHGATASTPSGR